MFGGEEGTTKDATGAKDNTGSFVGYSDQTGFAASSQGGMRLDWIRVFPALYFIATLINNERVFDDWLDDFPVVCGKFVVSSPAVLQCAEFSAQILRDLRGLRSHPIVFGPSDRGRGRD